MSEEIEINNQSLQIIEEKENDNNEVKEEIKNDEIKENDYNEIKEEIKEEIKNESNDETISSNEDDIDTQDDDSYEDSNEEDSYDEEDESYESSEEEEREEDDIEEDNELNEIQKQQKKWFKFLSGPDYCKEDFMKTDKLKETLMKIQESALIYAFFKMTKLEKEYNEVVNEYNEAKDEIKSLEDKIEGLNDEIDDLNDELDDLNNRNKELMKDNSQLQTIDELNQQISKLKRELETKEKELEENENQLNDISIAFKKIVLQLDNLKKREERVNNLAEEYEEMSNALETKTKENICLKEELKQLKEEKLSKYSENEEYEKKIFELQNELRDFRLKENDLENQLNKVSEQKEETNNQLKMKEMLIETLFQDNHKKDEELTELKKRIERYERMEREMKKSNNNNQTMMRTNRNGTSIMSPIEIQQKEANEIIKQEQQHSEGKFKPKNMMKSIMERNSSNNKKPQRSHRKTIEMKKMQVNPNNCSDVLMPHFNGKNVNKQPKPFRLNIVGTNANMLKSIKPVETQVKEENGTISGTISSQRRNASSKNFVTKIELLPHKKPEMKQEQQQGIVSNLFSFVGNLFVGKQQQTHENEDETKMKREMISDYKNGILQQCEEKVEGRIHSIETMSDSFYTIEEVKWTENKTKCKFVKKYTDRQSLKVCGPFEKNTIYHCENCLAVKSGEDLYFVVQNEYKPIRIKFAIFNMFIPSKERIYVLNLALQLFYFDIETRNLKEVTTLKGNIGSNLYIANEEYIFSIMDNKLTRYSLKTHECIQISKGKRISQFTVVDNFIFFVSVDEGYHLYICDFDLNYEEETVHSYKTNVSMLKTNGNVVVVQVNGLIDLYDCYGIHKARVNIDPKKKVKNVIPYHDMYSKTYQMILAVDEKDIFKMNVDIPKHSLIVGGDGICDICHKQSNDMKCERCGLCFHGDCFKNSIRHSDICVVSPENQN